MRKNIVRHANTTAKGLEEAPSWRAFREYIPFSHWKVALGAVLAFHLLLSILRFDAKVSIGGDDSWYVIAALDFWEGQAFPSWHGAFYPILISPFVATFGIHVPILKIFSILFSLASIAFLGIAFRRYLPRYVWLFALLLTAASPQMVALAGSTYSEPLFMLLQSLAFLLFLPLCNLSSGILSRQTLAYLLPLGLVLFLLSLTRNVGYGAVIALLLFLLIVKRSWRRTVALLGSFLLFFIPFAIYKHLRWGVADASFAGQLSKMMLVDFYNPAGETETLWGLCIRVWQNALQYLTYHCPSFLGVELPDVSVALLLLLLAGGVAIVSARRIRSAFTWLLAIYLVVMLGVTFLSQQVSWNQFRLVIIYLPLLLAFFFYGIHCIFAKSAPRLANGLIGGLAGLSLLVTTTSNLEQVDETNLSKNLQGDQFAGLTPDWDSYLRVCQWAGDHLPDSAVIACRKPNNAQIYANRPFHGVFRYISEDPDTVWAYFDAHSIDYLILGRLRTLPSRRTDRYINSLHFNAYRLLESKPDCLELLYHEGSSEPAYLFRINRENLLQTDPERYRKAIETGLIIHPNNFDALHKLALLALQQQRPNDAIIYADRATAIANCEKIPVPYPILEVRAIAIYLLGDPQQAASIFEQLMAADPNNPSHIYNLALCLQEQNPARAQALFAKAKSLTE